VLIENFGNVLDWFGPLSRANDMVSRVCWLDSSQQNSFLSTILIL
jgi:hypothetical protein